MYTRNQFMKFKLHCNTDDGGEGGGNNAPAAKPGAENNNEGDLIDHGTLWDNEASSDTAPAAQPSAAPAAQPVSAAQAFDAHVQTINFGSDPAAMMEAVREGNVEAFTEQLQNMQVGIYKAGMLDANKMMQQTTNGLKTEMQTETATSISSDKLISQMNEQLPYTAEPAYAPMAKAVISKLLSKKGMTPEKAIIETGKYFSNMANSVGGNMQGNLGNNQHGNNNQFGNSNNQDEDMDWVAFMGGKPE